MKRYSDICVEFYIYTAPYHDEYGMFFDVNWKFRDILDFMCDKYSIDPDTITEIRHTYVRRYELSKDA